MSDSRPKPLDYYELLGVGRTATTEQIGAAYRRLALQCHPDVCPNTPEAATQFKAVHEAFEVLRDAQKRRRYDQQLARRDQRAPCRATVQWHDVKRPSGIPAGPCGPQPWIGPLAEFFTSAVDSQSAAAPNAVEGRPVGSLDLVADLLLTPRQAKHGGFCQLSLYYQDFCPDCGGAGQRRGHSCRTCDGYGLLQCGPRPLRVYLPPKLRNGTVLRIVGAGKTTASTALRGDLHLRISVRPCW